MKTVTRTATGRTWTYQGMLAVVGLILTGFVLQGRAAGTLTPAGAVEKPIQIRAHHANVVINNGFAQTEVTQTFYNPNGKDLEGIYAFPLPKTASLSEMTIWAGEQELNGEVLAKKDADII